MAMNCSTLEISAYAIQVPSRAPIPSCSARIIAALRYQ
jgi:hypothetical protein